MRTKFFVFWLLGFICIAAIVYFGAQRLSELPLDKPVAQGEPVKAVSENKLSPALSDSGFDGLESVSPSEKQAKLSAPLDKAPVVNKADNPEKPENSKVSDVENEKLQQELITEEAQAKLTKDKLRTIRSELQKMAKSDPSSIDFAKLDGLLAELEAMGGPGGVVGGVNISQLRKIVTQSNKIIMTSQNKGLAPGEDRNEKLKQEVKTLQELQKGLVVKP